MVESKEIFLLLVSSLFDCTNTKLVTRLIVLKSDRFPIMLLQFHVNASYCAWSAFGSHMYYTAIFLSSIYNRKWSLLNILRENLVITQKWGNLNKIYPTSLGLNSKYRDEVQSQFIKECYELCNVVNTKFYLMKFHKHINVYFKCIAATGSKDT